MSAMPNTTQSRMLPGWQDEGWTPVSLRCLLGLHQLRTLIGRPCTREGHTHA